MSFRIKATHKSLQPSQGSEQPQSVNVFNLLQTDGKTDLDSFIKPPAQPQSVPRNGSESGLSIRSVSSAMPDHM